MDVDYHHARDLGTTSFFPDRRQKGGARSRRERRTGGRTGRRVRTPVRILAVASVPSERAGGTGRALAVLLLALADELLVLLVVHKLNLIIWSGVEDGAGVFCRFIPV